MKPERLFYFPVLVKGALTGAALFGGVACGAGHSREYAKNLSTPLSTPVHRLILGEPPAYQYKIYNQQGYLGFHADNETAELFDFYSNQAKTIQYILSSTLRPNQYRELHPSTIPNAQPFFFNSLLKQGINDVPNAYSVLNNYAIRPDPKNPNGYNMLLVDLKADTHNPVISKTMKDDTVTVEINTFFDTQSSKITPGVLPKNFSLTIIPNPKPGRQANIKSLLSTPDEIKQYTNDWIGLPMDVSWSVIPPFSTQDDVLRYGGRVVDGKLYKGDIQECYTVFPVNVTTTGGFSHTVIVAVTTNSFGEIAIEGFLKTK